MYYESRQHNIIKCNSLKEVVNKIRKGEVQEYEALVLISKWTGEKFAFVSDTHIDDVSFGEVAVLNLTQQKQVESITNAWCSKKELKNMFKAELKATEHKAHHNLKGSLKFNNKNNEVYFTCGCCGDYFKSTLAIQEKFDQDSTYGICKSCEKYYL